MLHIYTCLRYMKYSISHTEKRDLAFHFCFGFTSSNFRFFSLLPISTLIVCVRSLHTVSTCASFAPAKAKKMRQVDLI